MAIIPLDLGQAVSSVEKQPPEALREAAFVLPEDQELAQC
jgi:hypothetical protein